MNKREKELLVEQTLDLLKVEKEALLRQIQRMHEEAIKLREEKLHHSTERARLAIEAKVKDAIISQMIARL
jgi:hypothetical protein